MLPAAPRSVTADRTAATEHVLPLHQAAHTSIRHKIVPLSVSIPLIIPVSETGQHIINLAEVQSVQADRLVIMGLAKHRL